MVALKTCPHWHSVFSSVFKEPKLGHILAAMFCLLGLVPMLVRRLVCRCGAKRNTSPAGRATQPRSGKNFDQVMRLLATLQQQVAVVQQRMSAELGIRVDCGAVATEP